MKTYLDIENWNRKEHFYHFKNLGQPYFGFTVNVDVTCAYQYSKKNNTSIFILYLYACMKAVNSIDNLAYRLEQDDKIAVYDKVHVSATILRPDNTFGFSFIHFEDTLDKFYNNFIKEKERILNSSDLFPPVYSEGCIYCTTIPWLNFTSVDEPMPGNNESIPRVAFGKITEKNKSYLMPVSIKVNHALLDGFHVSKFFEVFQNELNKIR